MQAVINEVKPYLDEVYALPLFDQAGFINREGWEFTGGNPDDWIVWFHLSLAGLCSGGPR